MKRSTSSATARRKARGSARRGPRRQGLGPRGDDRARHSRPAGLHDRHGRLQRRLREGVSRSTACKAEADAALARLEKSAGQAVRRSEGPAARVGAVGRALLDAGHDGHDPEPRADVEDAAGPRARRRGSGSRSTAAGASSRCTRTSCCACRAQQFEQGPVGEEEGARRRLRHGPRRRGPGRRRPAERGRRARGRPAGDFPGRPDASSSGARSAPSSSPGTTSARRPTASSTRSPTTGAPPSTSRRWSSETAARRRPRAWPSRATRRRARRSFYGEFLPNAQGEDVVAGIRTPRPLEPRRLGPVARRDDAAGLRGAPAGAGPAREALPRHAGPRVHDRGPQALPPPDAQRQAHGLRRRPRRDRHGGRGADRRRTRRSRASSRSSSCSCSRRSSTRRRRPRRCQSRPAPRQGPARRAGRGVGPDRA